MTHQYRKKKITLALFFKRSDNTYKSFIFFFFLLINTWFSFFVFTAPKHISGTIGTKHACHTAWYLLRVDVFRGLGGIKGRLQHVLSETFCALRMWWLCGIQGDWNCCDGRVRSDLLNSTGWYEKAQWQKTEREKCNYTQLFASTLTILQNGALQIYLHHLSFFF